MGRLISRHVQKPAGLVCFVIWYDIYFVPQKQWLLVYLPKVRPHLYKFKKKASVRMMFSMNCLILSSTELDCEFT